MKYKLHFSNIDFVYDDPDCIRKIKEHNSPIKCNSYSESCEYDNMAQLYSDLKFSIKQLDNVQVIDRHVNIFNDNAVNKATTMTTDQIIKYLRDYHSITLVNIGKYIEYFIVVKIINL